MDHQHCPRTEYILLEQVAAHKSSCSEQELLQEEGPKALVLEVQHYYHFHLEQHLQPLQWPSIYLPQPSPAPLVSFFSILRLSFSVPRLFSAFQAVSTPSGPGLQSSGCDLATFLTEGCGSDSFVQLRIDRKHLVYAGILYQAEMLHLVQL